MTGVTTMLMDVGLDTGDMLLKTEVSVDAKETGGTCMISWRQQAVNCLREH